MAMVRRDNAVEGRVALSGVASALGKGPAAWLGGLVSAHNKEEKQCPALERCSLVVS